MFDPVVLFQLGPLTVTAYGVCLAVAIAVSLLALRPRAKRMGMPEGTVLRFGLTAIPLAVVGARLFYCAVRARACFLNMTRVSSCASGRAASALPGRLAAARWRRISPPAARDSPSAG